VYASEAPRPSRRAQAGDRDRHVVEDAVAARRGAARVVRAAAQVHADAHVERVARRLHGGLDRAPRALHELAGPREAEHPLRAPVERALAQRPQVVGIVDRLERCPGHRARVPHLAEARRLHGLAQQPVLRLREPMSGRQRHRMAVV
jgi:hypothetical protein